MTEAGLALLAEDSATRALLLVAKHPDSGVADRLHGLLAKLGKPVAVRYLGEGRRGEVDGVLYAGSLDEAAEAAAGRIGAAPSTRGDAARGGRDARDSAEQDGRRLVGLFGGGSLAAEARCVLEARGIATRVPEEKLSANAALPSGNLVVDTGDDAYTVGRPHPMVDQTVRCGLIRAAGSDPSVGVLLLDLVLGDGAHPDPAHEIVEAVAAAVAARSGLPLSVVASVCGTRRDPQGTARQEETLRRAGVVARPSAALAAAEAADLVLVARQEVVR